MILWWWFFVRGFGGRAEREGWEFTERLVRDGELVGGELESKGKSLVEASKLTILGWVDDHCCELTLLARSRGEALDE